MFWNLGHSGAALGHSPGEDGRADLDERVAVVAGEEAEQREDGYPEGREGAPVLGGGGVRYRLAEVPDGRLLGGMSLTQVGYCKSASGAHVGGAACALCNQPRPTVRACPPTCHASLGSIAPPGAVMGKRDRVAAVQCVHWAVALCEISCLEWPSQSCSIARHAYVRSLADSVRPLRLAERFLRYWTTRKLRLRRNQGDDVLCRRS